MGFAVWWLAAVFGFGMWQAPPTEADVLAMLASVPDRECVSCSGIPRGAFARAPDAPAIASAIAATVAGEEEAWRWARLGVVYVAFEGGARACPRSGDGGRSHGGWQMQRLSRADACRPEVAFPAWLALAKQSEAACASLPADERLAALASGSCARARRKVKARSAVADGLSP